MQKGSRCWMCFALKTITEPFLHLFSPIHLFFTLCISFQNLTEETPGGVSKTNLLWLDGRLVRTLRIFTVTPQHTAINRHAVKAADLNLQFRL